MELQGRHFNRVTKEQTTQLHRKNNKTAFNILSESLLIAILQNALPLAGNSQRLMNRAHHLYAVQSVWRQNVAVYKPRPWKLFTLHLSKTSRFESLDILSLNS